MDSLVTLALHRNVPPGTRGNVIRLNHRPIVGLVPDPDGVADAVHCFAQFGASAAPLKCGFI